MDKLNVFKNFVMESNPIVKDIYCHNFSHIKENEYSSGEDNSLFIVQLNEKCDYIKINHKIKSEKLYSRLKMYYATAPENAFCEENSYELGFMDGEEYSYILKCNEKKQDSFRFDFGFDPVTFWLEKFEISIPTKEEIETIPKEEQKSVVKGAFHYILNNGLQPKKVVQKIKEYGLKGALQKAKTKALAFEKEKNADKATIQVVEPYKVVLKNPVENNRKKVLHIIENFYTGGSSRLIIDIVEYYGHKYEQKIFTMAFRGADEFLDIDVEIIDIENKKEVLQKIKQYAPDIIHVHIWEGQWYHKVFDLLSEVKGPKFVQNINTPLNPILKDYIDKYVFVSHYVLENFHDKEDKKSMVIYPGSNFDMFTRELKENYLARDTIGMVYRLGYDKLNQHSIDVFIKTIQKRPQTKAIIVGGGPQYDYYVEKVQKAGLSEKFLFTGYVPYVELPKLYEQFTIFVAPVWKESFGQVTPFAMSMGIPVAGYNIGALNEIINNPSLLAQPDNSDELSDKLAILLNDYEKCEQIGKENQERAWNLFGVKTMVDNYFHLYEDLTKNE